MKEKDFERWKKLRKKGVLRFVLQNGVLAWGVPVLIVMAFINKPFENGMAPVSAIIHCVVYPIGGIFFGLVLWLTSEERYNKELANRENT